MAKITETLAVLFADISGSTSLYETLGDAKARELVSACIAVLTKAMAKHKGRLIKTIGDEIMCVFPSAEAAALAACDMQSSVETEKPGGSTPMFVRIGFHYGEVISENGDVFGDTVNTAARIAGVARARQILATQGSVDALPGYLIGTTRQIRRSAVKGKQEAVEICEVQWQADDTEVTRISMPVRSKHGSKRTEVLVLRHDGKAFTVDANHRSAVIGRNPACQIVVADDFASRQHAKIELIEDKFILADQSINGTYVRFADGHVHHAVQEQVQLRGSGSISLGRAFFETAVKEIEFSIETRAAS